jgi:hypothetical protein
MNRKNIIQLMLAIFAVGMQSHSSAETNKTLTTNDASRMFSATFISTNPSGCISTEINISGKVLSDQKSSSAATIDVFKHDDCKNKALISGIGKTKLSKRNILLGKHLNKITLKTKIKIFDTVSLRKKPISIKATWKGFGKTIHSQPKIYTVEAGKYVNERKKILRKTRRAIAFGEFIILGKKNKFHRADDATLTLLQRPASSLSAGKSRSIPLLINNDPVEED